MTTDYNMDRSDLSPNDRHPHDLQPRDIAIARSCCAALRRDQIAERHGALMHQLHELLRRQQQLRRAARAELATGGIAGAYRLLGSATHQDAQRHRACA